jgi:Ca-activated chloride channel family protein
MEQLANKGNGNYGYVDDEDEARLLLVERLMGTLVTIAKDVKIQVEFNPRHVRAYRLLGYENRKLKAQDFNDDKKDAGEIGAGHTVTALYEIVPSDNDEKLDLAKPEPQPEEGTVDPLRYQLVTAGDSDSSGDVTLQPSDDLLTVKIRYKQPEGTKSILMQQPVANEFKIFEKTSADFKQAVSAAGFGMLLRHSKYSGSLTYDNLLAWTDEVYEAKQDKLNHEFRRLVEIAKRLDVRHDVTAEETEDTGTEIPD